MPSGTVLTMTIGASIFLIAVGAILAFAIDLGKLGPVEIETVGIILMIAGIVGLIIGFFLMSRAPRRGETVREREIR